MIGRARWLLVRILVGVSIAYGAAFIVLWFQLEKRFVFFPSTELLYTPNDAGLQYEDVRFQAAVDLFSSGAVAEVAARRSVAEILEEAAPEAALVPVKLMKEAEKEDVQLRAAEAVLDRTGHARQTEVRKTVVNIDVDAAALIEETKRIIAAAQIPEAEVEVIE